MNSSKAAILGSKDLATAYSEWLVSQGMNKRRRKPAEASARSLVAGSEYKALAEKIKLGTSPDQLKKLTRGGSSSEPMDPEWKLPCVWIYPACALESMTARDGQVSLNSGAKISSR